MAFSGLEGQSRLEPFGRDRRERLKEAFRSFIAGTGDLPDEFREVVELYFLTKRYSQLPHAGGLVDQPVRLLRDFETIEAVMEERRSQEEKGQRTAEITARLFTELGRRPGGF